MRLLSVLGFWILTVSLASCNPSSAAPTLDQNPPTPTTQPPASADVADIIFTNGDILTMDPADSRAEAIAIHGDKILAVGANEAVLAYQAEETIVVDLGGTTVLPGFIDSHTHRITQRYKWEFSTVEEAAQEAISQGWTGLVELAVDEGQFNELRAAAEQDQLHVRVNVYLTANTFEGQLLDEWYNAYEPGQQFGPYLRIAGLKVFIDGNSGRILYWEQDELSEFLSQRQSEGWQIAIKAIGIESHELALSAYQAILREQSNQLYRHRIEHSLAVNDAQLARLAQMQIITSVQPDFPAVIWHEADIRALVAEQGMENIFRWRQYQDAGVFMVASPYNPDGVNTELTLPSHVSPMGLLHRSVAQIGLEESSPEPWMLPKTLTVEEILPMLTLNGAYATFEADLKGSLTAGKLADLVMLSENPLDAEAENLKDIEVLMTMIGGAVEWCAPGREALCPDAALSATVENLFIGNWTSVDPADGSDMSLQITRDNHDYTVVLTDEVASICGTDGLAARITSPGTVEGNLLTTTITSVECLGEPSSLLERNLTIDYTYQNPTDTLVDSNGVIWSRR